MGSEMCIRDSLQAEAGGGRRGHVAVLPQELGDARQHFGGHMAARYEHFQQLPQSEDAEGRRMMQSSNQGCASRKMAAQHRIIVIGNKREEVEEEQHLLSKYRICSIKSLCSIRSLPKHTRSIEASAPIEAPALPRASFPHGICLSNESRSLCSN